MFVYKRRLAPEAVVALDWHNDMSKLILNINDRIEAAADDRARYHHSEAKASVGDSRLAFFNTDKTLQMQALNSAIQKRAESCVRRN